MNYRFVKVPDCIDTSRPIMPLRDEDEKDWLYGVDVAWLGEVLMTWSAASNNHVYGQQEMSEYPAVSGWHNFLRGLARSIKDRSESKYIFSALPGAHKIDESDIEPVHFGDVPADVIVGDPMRRTDISDMFDWMAEKHPKFVKRYMLNIETEIVSSTTNHGDEGNRSWEELSAPGDNCVYRWNWFYLDTHGSIWAHLLDGGAWRRDERTIKMSGRIANCDASWFSSCTLFAEFDSSCESVYNKLFLPLTGCTFEQSGNDVAVSGRMDPATAKALLNVTEKQYKSDLHTDEFTEGQGYSNIIIVKFNAKCFFELAQDYRHP